MTFYHATARGRWPLSLLLVLACASGPWTSRAQERTGDSMEDEPSWLRAKKDGKAEKAGAEASDEANGAVQAVESAEEAGGQVEPGRDGRLRAWGWVAIVAGGALAIGGGALGLAALRLDGELSESCPDGLCPPNRHDDLDRRDNLAGGSTALIAVGAAAVLTGVLILTVFSTGRYSVEVDRRVVALWASPVANRGAFVGVAWRFE